MRQTEVPDKGWAWVVAFAALAINFITAGLFRAAGILYVAFLETYRVDRKGASMPFAVRTSTRNLLAPLVGMLGQKYGVPAVTIAGGILGTTSSAICFFLNDIAWLTIVWGIFNGVAIALITVLPQVVVNQHFKKYRTTASGMTFCGGCIGSFFLPAVFEHMLLLYGLQGTFLILAGMLMHTIPAAMILKEPSWITHPTKGLEPKQNSDNIPSCKQNAINYPFQDLRKDHEIDVQLLRENGGLILQFLSDIPGENSSYEIILADEELELYSPNRSDILQELELIYCSLKIPQVINFQNTMELQNEKGFNVAWLLQPIENCKNYFFKKRRTIDLNKHLNRNDNPATTELVKFQSLPNITELYNQMSIRNYIITKLQHLSDDSEKRVLSYFPEDNRENAAQILFELRKLHAFCSNIRSSIQVIHTAEVFTSKNGLQVGPKASYEAADNNINKNMWLQTKLALKLHRKPIFLLICACRTAYFLTFGPVVTMIVDFAMDKGFREEYGKYVIASLAAGDLIGRLCFGWITDRGYMTPAKYMLFVMITQGASTVSIPLMNSEVTFLPMIALFGALQGSLFVRHPVLVSKYMEESEQSVAMGCLDFSSGLIGFLVPYYIGHFRDDIGSYNSLFYINGALGTFIGFLWFFEPYFVKKSSTHL